MHKYYYLKDNAYYVMNDNNTLEKYQVKNNIEIILNLENMIYFFKQELKSNDIKFCYKPKEELNKMEWNQIMEVTPLVLFLEYYFLKDNTISALILQTTVFNIFNNVYKSYKDCTQEAEWVANNSLREIIADLTKQLENFNYQKNIVSLSEFDSSKKKTILTFSSDLMNSYKNDINIDVNLNINPEEIFGTYEVSYDNPDYQKKVLQARKYCLETMPEKVLEKLKYLENESSKFWLYTLANGSIAIAAITKILKDNLDINFLDKYQKNIIFGVIVISSLSLFSYYKLSKENKEIPNPILTLKKDR